MERQLCILVQSLNEHTRTEPDKVQMGWVRTRVMKLIWACPLPPNPRVSWWNVILILNACLSGSLIESPKTTSQDLILSSVNYFNNAEYYNKILKNRIRLMGKETDLYQSRAWVIVNIFMCSRCQTLKKLLVVHLIDKRCLNWIQKWTVFLIRPRNGCWFYHLRLRKITPEWSFKSSRNTRDSKIYSFTT